MYYAIESIAALQICYIINTLPCVLHFGFEIQQNVNTGNDRERTLLIKRSNLEND